MEVIGLKDLKTNTEKHKIIEYNSNPFTPHGKMKRSSFLIGGLIMNLTFLLTIGAMVSLLQKQFGLNDKILLFLFVPAGIYYFICNVFIVKKRLYDMTLKSVQSWVLSVVLLLFGIAASITYESGHVLLELLGIILLFAKSKEVEQGQKIINKEENPIFKNNLINIYNFILINKKKAIIAIISVLIVFIIFRLTCYEHRIVKNKVITINKITGKVVNKDRF